MADNIILSWDAVIADEGSGGVWKPLEEGDYDFEVEDYKKTYAKDNVTPVAELTLRIGDTTVRDWLHFKKNAEWKISQFLIGASLKKHGEPIQVPWDKLIGAKGRCHINVSTFTKRDGTEGKGNNVAYYIEPAQPTTGNMAW